MNNDLEHFITEKKAAITQSFNTLKERREQDLESMNKLQGQYALIEELEQHIKENTPQPKEDKKNGK